MANPTFVLKGRTVVGYMVSSITPCEESSRSPHLLLKNTFIQPQETKQKTQSNLNDFCASVSIPETPTNQSTLEITEPTG
jgi:hypothetical protein